MRAILTMHSIDESGSAISLSPTELEGLLDGIARSGHRIVPLSELLARPGVPDQVAITFDDGLASVVEEALPILARRGLVATVFVVTGYLGRTNDWPGQPTDAPRLPMMGWEEMEALTEAGWEVGSHTVSHPDLTGLSPDGLEPEIQTAAETIRRRLGVAPQTMAYPYGKANRAVMEAAGKQHRWALGTRLAALDPSVDHPLELPRLDAYYLRESWTHGLFGGPLLGAWLAGRRRLRAVRGALR